MILEKIDSLKEDIWNLQKQIVIDSMIYNYGLNYKLVKMIIKYKRTKITELNCFRNILGSTG